MIGDPKKLYNSLKENLPEVADIPEQDFINLAKDKVKFSKFYNGLKESYPDAVDIEEKDFMDRFGDFDNKDNSYFINQTKSFDTKKPKISEPVVGVHSPTVLRKEREKITPYQGAPLSPQVAKNIDAFDFDPTPRGTYIDEIKDPAIDKSYVGKPKKELEQTLQILYKLQDDKTISEHSKKAQQKQINSLVDYLGGIDNPDRYRTVDGAKSVFYGTQEGKTPSNAYEIARDDSEKSLKTIKEAYGRVNKKLLEGFGTKEDIDVLQTYNKLQELEDNGDLTKEQEVMKATIEGSEHFANLQKFGKLKAEQEEDYAKNFPDEKRIEDIRESFQSLADSEQRQGKSSNISRIVNSTGNTFAESVKSMYDAVQEVFVETTGYMFPKGQEAAIYNGLVNSGNQELADKFFLSRYKENKVDRESKLAVNVLPSDITKPLFEENVNVEGYNFILDKDKKVVGARDEEGFKIPVFTEDMVSKAKEFESNPTKYETTKSSDKLQRAKSLGWTAGKVMSDMAPILVTATATGGSSMGVTLPMFSQLFGDYYNKSFEQGKKGHEALAYATLSAGLQAVIETKIGGFEQRFARQFSRDGIKESTVNLAENVINGAITSRDAFKEAAKIGERVIKDVAGENIEEWTQARGDEINNTVFNIQQDPKSFLDDVETAAVTILATAPLSTVTAIASRDNFKESIRRAIESPESLDKAMSILLEAGVGTTEDVKDKKEFINKIATQAKEYEEVGGYGEKDLDKIKDLLVDLAIEEKRLQTSTTNLGKNKSIKEIESIKEKLKPYDEELANFERSASEELTPTEDATNTSSGTNVQNVSETAPNIPEEEQGKPYYSDVPSTEPAAETPKAETKVNTSNVEEGSGGVGGDVAKDDKGVPVNEGKWYHGTPVEGINQLKPNDKGLIFFTRDRNIAERYATNDFDGNTPSNNIFEKQLSAKNIFDPEKQSENKKVIELLANTGDFTEYKERDFDKAAQQALEDGDWRALETKEFIDGLKKLGYDAIFIDNRPHYSENAKGERTFSRDIAVFDSKAVEQSLKETTKAETPKSNEVQAIEKERDEKLQKLYKPTLSLSFVEEDNTALNTPTGAKVKVKAGNRVTERPQTYKDVQKALKKDQETLQKLIDCL